MSKKIVCGIDNSETAAAAARKAAELTAAYGGTLYVVTAFGKFEAETINVGSDEILLSNEQESDQVAEELATQLRMEFPGIVVETLAVEGAPGEALVKVANSLEADVIVVGNKRVQGIARVLGSIARDVAAHAPCDVYVAHTHSRD